MAAVAVAVLCFFLLFFLAGGGEQFPASGTTLKAHRCKLSLLHRLRSLYPARTPLAISRMPGNRGFDARDTFLMNPVDAQRFVLGAIKSACVQPFELPTR